MSNKCSAFSFDFVFSVGEEFKTENNCFILLIFIYSFFLNRTFVWEREGGEGGRGREGEREREGERKREKGRERERERERERIPFNLENRGIITWQKLC